MTFAASEFQVGEGCLRGGAEPDHEFAQLEPLPLRLQPSE